MPTTPRLRQACDVCHNLKVRCSGTMPCQGCAESGASCFYSISNRLGRPPGAKNKRSASSSETASLSAANEASIPPSTRTPTMIVPPQQLMVFPEDSTGERATVGQSRWSLNRPAPPRRQRSDPQTRQPRRKTEGVLTPSTSSAESDIGSSGNDHTIGEDFMGGGGGNSMRDLDCLRRVHWETSGYGFSGLLGGDWNWSGRPTGSSGVENRDHFNYDDMMLDDPTSFVAMPHLSELGNIRTMPPDPISQVAQSELSAGLSSGSGPEHMYPGQSLLPHEDECACLQKHTELLCALKKYGAIRGSPKSDGGNSAFVPVGRIMANIQDAFKTWKTFINCPSCSQDGDQEVLLLSLMCARAVLCQLEGITWNGDSGSSTPADSSPTLTLGEFEVEGDEKSMLLQALRSITLRKIEAVLMRLREVLERIKRLEGGQDPYRQSENRRGRVEGGWMDPRNGDEASNLAYAEQMLQGLVRYVRVLEGGYSSNQINI
ncbi:hypothetical protein F5Y04DRAFT_291092 [Hypomontagnella monticulosa]|nr:hypothetical protein F5Y04DRAFT_291092 [Hypomontagnella monticulosa]